MTSEEIYMSIGLDKYKINKANILKSQICLLNSLKNIHKMLFISRQKNDLKKKLQQTIISLKSEVNSLEKKLPVAEIPKEFKKEPEFVVTPIKDYSKKDKIDRELKLIKEKLYELNEWLS